jgi:hypothetical protein
MRTWSAVVLALAGFSLWSCSDEAAGPGVGPDTSWQIGCSGIDEGCGSSLNAHGPLAGLDDDPEVKYDDVKLKVTCEKSAAGLRIRIEDPGRSEPDSEDPGQRKWAQGILEITNAKPEENKCFVKVTDDTGTRYNLQETCSGTSGTGLDGECEITGEEDSNGYAFEGTLFCPGMHVGNSTPRPFRLGAARNSAEPLVLQIQTCK